MNQIYRIKFTYTEETETGKVVKKKMECLAQCVNYTDAETLANVIIDREGFDNVSYEIIKTKIESYSILLNNLLDTDEKLTCKLNELFFSGEEDTFVCVKVNIFATPENDKDTKEEYIIPAKSNVAAIDYLAKYLSKVQEMTADKYVVEESKRDKAEILFLEPAIYESKMSNAIPLS